MSTDGLACAERRRRGERERPGKGCILLGLLRYVHEQAQGDKLKASIEDDDMIQIYLSAGKLREIASLLNDVERGVIHGLGRIDTSGS